MPAPIAPSAELDTFITAVKSDLLNAMIEEIRQNKMTQEQAEDLSADFLKILPAINKSDFLEKFHALGLKYGLLLPLYLQYITTDQENKKQETLTSVSQLLQAGNIEEAIQAAKKGTE